MSGSAALERILDITRHLAAPFDLKTMLAEVVDAGRELLGADRGSVFLYDAATDELVSAVATGLGEIRIPAGHGIVGQAAQTRTVVNVRDVTADPRFNPEMDRKSGYRTRCLLTVPMVGADDSLVGVLQLLNKRDGTFEEEDERVITALAAQCAVALQRTQYFEQRVLKEKLDRELAVAREIQIGFLPRTMPVLPGFEVAGLSRPADETGGDTFDLIPVDGDRLVILLGDAAGHGVGPALSVTQVRSMLRMASRLGAGLEASLTQINAQLVADMAPGRFVTAFLGVLDARSSTVEYRSAGQGPLLYYHAASRRCDLLEPTHIPLGLLEEMPPAVAARLDFAPGDILALITDGLFEYADASGGMFGTERVEALIDRNRDRPLDELAALMLSEARTFAGTTPQPDDITIVLLRRAPVGDAPPTEEKNPS